MKISDYLIPANIKEDIDLYENEVKRFITGDISPSVFRAKRVPRGIYEQRQDGTFMMRVRVAGGVLKCNQVHKLAELSHKYGNGLLHITTRQDIQLHDLKIQDTPLIMKEIAQVGLSSKGGGGNTVRNIVVCPYAGICPKECFDVTECAHVLTKFFISHPGSYNLPRKYKISFSGCSIDCALCKVADLGFVAITENGNPGFKVYVGGGMGAYSRIADVLVDYAPVTDIIKIAETVRRLFDKLGDRTNKHKARLRFVLDKIGTDEFRKKYVEEFEKVKRESLPAWDESIKCENTSPQNSPVSTYINDIEIIPQRQHAYITIPLNVPLGFISADDLEHIGKLAELYSEEKELHTTRYQNLLIRFVKENKIHDLISELQSLCPNLLSFKAIHRFIACAGASTCRLGICLSRNAAKACGEILDSSGIKNEILHKMEFYINGCTNACGQQPIGMIGFFGTAQRVGERLVPCYGITIGGYCNEEGARLGINIGKIPVRSLPYFVRDLVQDFSIHRKQDENFINYFERIGYNHFVNMANVYSRIPTFQEHPEFYRDIGAEADFSLAGRGAGECGAGVFEVIQQDISLAKKANIPFDILLPSVRALLITRGIDSQDPQVILREFEKYFIDTQLVGEEYRELISRAKAYLYGWKEAFDNQYENILRLRDRVELLFSTLDANLEFHPPNNKNISEDYSSKTVNLSKESGDTTCSDVVELDLRGVKCPMNFVKAKLKLETIDIGQKLAVILDEGEPIQNVPASFKNEGQEICEISKFADDSWRVVICRKK